MSRAGLISLLLLTVWINLVASAPLPERLSTLVERHNGYDVKLFVRSLATVVNFENAEREYLSDILDDREYDIEDNEYTKREYNDFSLFDERDFDALAPTFFKRDVFDVHTLRRRSIWDKIKNGFRNAGNAIKNGFHKVQAGFQRAGGAIRNGFRKAGGAIKSGFQRAGGAIRNGFQKVRSGFQRAGGAIRAGFQRVGGAIKQGFQRVRAGFQKAGGAIRNGFQKVKQGFQTAGRAMKKGFGIVGTAIKNNIGKVAKFGLKVVAAAASVASKVVKFIPGIGTGIGMALKGVAMGANEASKRIHASLGSQLDKASAGMDYVISPMGSVGKLAANGRGGQAVAAVESIFL